MKDFFRLPSAVLSYVKIIQTSEMKVFFQIAECSLSYANLDKISEL